MYNKYIVLLDCSHDLRSRVLRHVSCCSRVFLCSRGVVFVGFCMASTEEMDSPLAIWDSLPPTISPTQQLSPRSPTRQFSSPRTSPRISATSPRTMVYSDDESEATLSLADNRVFLDELQRDLEAEFVTPQDRRHEDFADGAKGEVPNNGDAYHAEMDVKVMITLFCS